MDKIAEIKKGKIKPLGRNDTGMQKQWQNRYSVVYGTGLKVKTYYYCLRKDLWYKLYSTGNPKFFFELMSAI